MSRKAAAYDFLNGSTGQIISRDDIAARKREHEAFLKRKALEEQEEEEYQILMKKINEYEEAKEAAIKQFWVYQEEARRLTSPLFQGRDALRIWLETKGVDEDPWTWLDAHQAKWPIFYKKKRRSREKKTPDGPEMLDTPATDTPATDEPNAFKHCGAQSLKDWPGWIVLGRQTSKSSFFQELTPQ